MACQLWSKQATTVIECILQSCQFLSNPDLSSIGEPWPSPPWICVRKIQPPSAPQRDDHAVASREEMGLMRLEPCPWLPIWHIMPVMSRTRLIHGSHWVFSPFPAQMGRPSSHALVNVHIILGPLSRLQQHAASNFVPRDNIRYYGPDAHMPPLKMLPCFIL